MLRRFVILLLAVLPLAAAAQSAPSTSVGTPRLGIDYEVLATPIATFRNTPGKVEVVEVFSYACIHCAHFEPLLSQWQAKKMPKGARLELVPTAFGGVGDNFARAYYAAEALGVLASTHDDLFRAVHEERQFQTGSLDEIADYFAKQGVDRSKFLAAMSSPETDAKLDKVREFTMAANIQGTPTLVINGKYTAMTTTERGFEGQLATAEFLIAKELAAAKATKPAKTR